ncbi:MAG: FKBP-type peptidyl-prolyl cis-trans isomerase [Bacteroidia bacterium]
MADQVQKDKVVSFSYTLKDSDGNILEQTDKNRPMEYLHGNQNIIPGLEREMEGLNIGDSKSVSVDPKDGYGEYNTELSFRVPRDNFPEGTNLEPGMEFQTETENGPMVITITEVLDNEVVVDANHPMAGQTLHFDITINNVREATAQEKQHGHVHAHGHDH